MDSTQWDHYVKSMGLANLPNPHVEKVPSVPGEFFFLACLACCVQSALTFSLCCNNSHFTLFDSPFTSTLHKSISCREYLPLHIIRDKSKEENRKWRPQAARIRPPTLHLLPSSRRHLSPATMLPSTKPTLTIALLRSLTLLRHKMLTTQCTGLPGRDGPS